MSVKLFFCYAHEDEPLLNKLKSHLSPLQRQGLIQSWHDRDISAGAEWESIIKEHLNDAQIILFLVSPDFMTSDYCYGIEMNRALERHEQGEAHIIPVILRPVYWQETPLSQFQALPTDGKPIISHDWHTPDDAFLDVTLGIREVISQIQGATLKLIIEGIFYRISGRSADALASFEKAIHLNPNEPYAYYNKYIVLIQLGDEKEAFKALSKSNDLGFLPLLNVIGGERYQPVINLFPPKTKINRSPRKTKN